MASTTFRIVDGERIAGRIFHAIRLNHKYFFVEVKVYADGVIECWEHFTLEKFKEYLDNGKILLSVPPKTTVHFHELGELKVQELVPDKTNEDFIKEIEDCINELNGRNGRVSKCVESFKQYLIKGDEKRFDLLKVLYDDLPSHQRVLFEIAYYKDPLVELMKTKVIQSEQIRQSIYSDYFEEEDD